MERKPPNQPTRSSRLPDGWSSEIDSRTGQVYYINHRNLTTQWEDPMMQTLNYSSYRNQPQSVYDDNPFAIPYESYRNQPQSVYDDNPFASPYESYRNQPQSVYDDNPFAIPYESYRNQPQSVYNDNPFAIPYENYSQFQNTPARSEGQFLKYRNQIQRTENPFLDYSKVHNNLARSEENFPNFRNSRTKSGKSQDACKSARDTRRGPVRFSNHRAITPLDQRLQDLEDLDSEDACKSARDTRRGPVRFSNHRAITPLDQRLQDLDNEDACKSARDTRRGPVRFSNHRAITPLDKRLQDLDNESDLEYYDEYHENEAVHYTDLRTGLPVMHGWKPRTDTNPNMFNTNQNRMIIQRDIQRQHTGFTDQRAKDVNLPSSAPGYINRRTRTELKMNSVPKQNIQTEKPTSDMTSTAPGYINRRTRTVLDINNVPKQKMQTEKRTIDVPSSASGHINRRTLTVLDNNSAPKPNMQTEKRTIDVPSSATDYINRRTRTQVDINSAPKPNMQTEKRASDVTSEVPGKINRRTRTELDINSAPKPNMQTEKRASDVTSEVPGKINRRTRTEVDINSATKQNIQTEKRVSNVTSEVPGKINLGTRTQLDINNVPKPNMQAVRTESSALLVAAIDFGTTYSGWAFSFKHEFEKDPIKISAKVWNSGESLSLKAPTCILINRDGKTIDSFGYEAETKYAELALAESHKEWYFFKRFKMMLFNSVGIKHNIVLEDASGKTLPAKTVFMLALKYLKDDMIKTSSKRLGESKISDNDIRWVLTVPAIWDDAAKRFMREAAKGAGIAEDKLMICLEPEAASIYCRHLPVEKNKGKEQIALGSFTAGTKYIILDAGGGTIDITVHEIMQNGKLRELHKATGGAWGGTKVDEAFEQLLGKVFGKANVKIFKDHHMDDYIDLFRQLELKKREISPSKDSKVTIRVPCSLIDIVEKQSKRKIKEYLQQTTYKDTMSITGEKLRVDANIARSCFSSTIESIMNHVAKLLQEPSVADCSAILMVGGFSDSPMLHEAIQDRFGQLTTIIPEEAELVVLKGAVIYGHDPKTVAERISSL